MVEPIVNRFEKKLSGKMAFKIEDWKMGDSPALITKYKLERHGMVITDTEGAMVWSESGHKQTEFGIEMAITEALRN